MREYLFRGKRVDNGEWVYGYYVKGATRHCVLKSLAQPNIYDVIPETVGEYTGLTDKNGKKIFEGDIVKTQAYSDRPFSSKRKEKRFLGIVEYYENKWKSESSRFINHIYNNGFRVKTLEDIGKFTHGAWSDFWDCEVIGNIHDNKELLGELL